MLKGVRVRSIDFSKSSSSDSRKQAIFYSQNQIISTAGKVSFHIRFIWRSRIGRYKMPMTMSSGSGAARTYIDREDHCACVNHLCFAPVPMKTYLFGTAIQAASLA